MVEEVLLHASAVAHAGRAALIIGASGSGKSALALASIALGAHLVADDQTLLRRQGESLLASAPDTLIGRIEVRGVGILAGLEAVSARVVLVIDLDQAAKARLPEAQSTTLHGLRLPLVQGKGLPGLENAVMAILRGAEIEG